MSEALEIALRPERLDDATPEERACFGMLTVTSPTGALTAGIDCFINAHRPGPLVSGYHAAQWFAWNWWRLRYEPRTRTAGWWRAHTMVAIGEGYAWPNVTIFSDGVRTTLLSSPSTRPDTKPFRYLGAPATVLPSARFEAAVDGFISQMEGRLIEQGLHDTNLSRLWAELRAERADPVEAERRRLEALLALDPDEAEDDVIDRLLADTERFGAEEVGELAAHQGDGGQPVDGADFDRMAVARGASGRVNDVVALRPGTSLPIWGEIRAWVVGARAAEALRQQAALGEEPVSDARLTALAGVEAQALLSPADAPLAFTLDSRDGTSASVLRSNHRTGRRFELARLIGDRLVRPTGHPLHTATRAYTYRQQMQRSFAAELLCPFVALEGYLDGDVSSEAQQEAATHFHVFDLTVRTLLVNHGLLTRDELPDFDLAA